MFVLNRPIWADGPESLRSPFGLVILRHSRHTDTIWPGAVVDFAA
jgi:hypothetical protein